MSVGLPVVATDCTPGGPAFLTSNGERGLLVPVHNVDAMANAILKLIENGKLSITFSKRASEIVEELDINVINKMWMEAFTQMIEKKNGR